MIVLKNRYPICKIFDSYGINNVINELSCNGSHNLIESIAVFTQYDKEIVNILDAALEYPNLETLTITFNLINGYEKQIASKLISLLRKSPKLQKISIKSKRNLMKNTN